MRALLLALAITVSAAGVSAEEPFEGEWIAVSAEENGGAAPELIGHRLSFDGDGFRIIDTDGALAYAGTYTAEPAGPFAAIDFTNTEGQAAGASWAGLWKQDGSLLTIIDNAPDPTKPRPDAFTAPVGSGYLMLVFERDVAPDEGQEGGDG
jgi:uncharacterized protein (TIGR03067 family)